MKITPIDIRQQQFARKLRGLDPREVDSFLNLVSDELEALHRENVKRKEELSHTRKIIDEYRDRENYYDDYSQINVNTLGNAIGRLGENGRAFLPFIERKIAEETEAIKQLEASIPEEEKSKRTNQDLLKRAYGKIQKLYYIKDSIESGTGSSNIFKYKLYYLIMCFFENFGCAEMGTTIAGFLMEGFEI